MDGLTHIFYLKSSLTFAENTS